MYKTAKALMALCQEASIIDVLLNKEYDVFEKDAPSVYESLENIYGVMEASSQLAISNPENYQGKIIGGDAKKMADFESENSYSGYHVNQAMARAFSSSEVNASMGKICAAPTAGSCGIIPSALFTATEKFDIEKERLHGLLVAAAIGEIITMNATVSGAEGGCQAECGSAAAMAAGMLVYFRGGSMDQIFNASAIALKMLWASFVIPSPDLWRHPAQRETPLALLMP